LIPHAASYEIMVIRTGEKPPPGGRFEDTFRLEQSTAGPTWTAELPPTTAGEAYLMRIVARGERAPIAEGGFGFTVR
jgi:hypothetical protein